MMHNILAYHRWKITMFVSKIQSFFNQTQNVLMVSILLIFLSVYPTSAEAATRRNTPNEVHLKLSTKTMLIGSQKLTVEIAKTEQQRSLGLMNRKSLDKNSGMWFIFDRAHPYCFWMKNTLIPLSIAFVNENYVIVDLFDMAPLSETPVCATQPVLYALEVNQGWFDQHRITPGVTMPRPNGQIESSGVKK